VGGVLSHTYIHTHGIRLSILEPLNTKPASQVLITVASSRLSELRQRLRSDAAATGLLANQKSESTRIRPRGSISRRLTAAKILCAGVRA